jgi:hypothetical protein
MHATQLGKLHKLIRTLSPPRPRSAWGLLRRIHDVRSWSAYPLSSRRNGALPRSVGLCQELTWLARRWRANLAGDAAFDTALHASALRVVQPDLAKWGGFSGCLPVARRILGAGLRFCPHYLGGGVGLLASAHLLAAVGGDGLLEIDANPNPLRSLLCAPLDRIENGRATLSDAAGVGIEPDLATLHAFVVEH